MRRSAAIGLALLLGTAIGLLVLEGGLRLSGPPRNADDLRSIHERRPDRPWLYGLRPHSEAVLESGVHYRINAQGFRDRERTVSKPSGVFRIAVVGDSLSFGWGVELKDTYPALLEARLSGGTGDGPSIEVLNFGVGGYNPYTEAQLLRDVVLDYEPDLVLVQFCINDLSDPTAHFGTHARQRLGALPAEAFPDPAMRRRDEAPPSAFEVACSRSRLCARLSDLYWEHWAAPIEKETHQAAGRPVQSTEGPEWEWLARNYGDMARAAEDAGAGFAALWFAHPGHTKQDFADPIYDRLGELARRGGWVALDLRDAFWRARAHGPLFLDYWHPSPTGHRVAADAVLERLSCMGALPDPWQIDCATTE